MRSTVYAPIHRCHLIAYLRGTRRKTGVDGNSIGGPRKKSRVRGSNSASALPGDAHNLQKDRASSDGEHQIPPHVQNRENADSERPNLESLKRYRRDRFCAFLVEEDQFLRPSPERAMHARGEHGQVEHQKSQCSYKLAACERSWKEREPAGEVHLSARTVGSVRGEGST